MKGDTKIDYISMMKMAQRAALTASMERVLAFAGNVGQLAVNQALPGPRTINPDALVREYADAVNMPIRIMRSEAEVEKLEQQQAAQQQNEQMWQKGQAGVNALQGLSKTDVGGGQNALAAMLGSPPPNESPSP